MPYTPWTTRTVGIEMEMRTTTRQRTVLRGASITDALVGACQLPVRGDGTRYHTSNGSSWDVKRDGSCGFEVASPALRFAEDGNCEELRNACAALQTLQPTIDRACGLHVHVDVSDYSWQDVQRVVTLFARYEPFFFELLPNSRQDNLYCPPLRATTWGQTPVRSHWQYVEAAINARTEAAFRQAISRTGKYTSLKVGDWWLTGRIEFRLHSGTIDYTKIRNWTLILLGLVERARADRTMGAPKVQRAISQQGREDGFCTYYLFRALGLRHTRFSTWSPGIDEALADELTEWCNERRAFFAPTRATASAGR